MNKRCPRCEQVKPLAEFYKHSGMKDGRQAYCIPCWKIKSHEWRLASPERFARYNAKRDRRKPDENRWREEHRKESRAHYKLYKAVKKGLLIRPDSCEECDREGRVEGHHKDYNQPLEVQWLCPQCHREQHLKVGYAKR